MNNKPKLQGNYIIKFSGPRGGEYDGGATIGDARKEAAFFAAHEPDRDIHIYRADTAGELHYFETVSATQTKGW